MGISLASTQVWLECDRCDAVSAPLERTPELMTPWSSERIAAALGGKQIPDPVFPRSFLEVCADCARKEAEAMAKNGSGNGKANGSGTMDGVKTEKLEKQLPVKLTEKEVAERADRAAHLFAECDAKEQAMKAAQKAAKAEIESLEAEHRRLSNEVRDKVTYRLVECEKNYYFRLNKVETTRMDTCETIEERPMLEHERQLEMKYEADKKRSAEDEAKALIAEAPPLRTEKKPKGKRKPKAAEASA